LLNAFSKANVSPSNNVQEKVNTSRKNQGNKLTSPKPIESKNNNIVNNIIKGIIL